MIFVVAIVLIASRDKEEELYGTWVNSDYNASAENAKRVINSDTGIRDDANGTIYFYTREYDERPEGGITFRIEEKWKGDEGSIWYKIEPFGMMVVYELWKISDSGATLEIASTRQTYPDEIDPTHVNYRIYYRQE
jgi:hypothetical protein